MFRKVLEFASKADSLPDASRLKTWSDILVALLTTPATVIVTLVGGSLAFFQWYLPYRDAELKKQHILKSPVHVAVTANAMPGMGAISIINGARYIPITVQVEAKNTTSREFAIVDSRWVAFGVQIVPSQIKNPENANEADLENHDSLDSLDSRHYSHYSERTRLIASGSIFSSDNAIRPSEVLRQSFVVYTKINEFNYLRLQLAVPIMAKSTQSYLANEFSLKPRILYRSNDVVGAIDWMLCPSGVSMSVSGEDVSFFKICQHMPDPGNAPKKRDSWPPIIGKMLNTEKQKPMISTDNYLLSFVTIALPFRSEMKY